MIQKYQQGTIGEVPPPKHDRAQYDKAIEDCKFDRALDAIWEKVRGLNQYIDEQKPWAIAKTGDTVHLQEVLAYQVGSLLEIAELLEPFMPDTAARIRQIFESGNIQAPPETLFPRIENPHAAPKPVTG